MNVQERSARVHLESQAVAHIDDRSATEVAAPPPPEAPAAASRAYVWYVIGLLSIANLFSQMDRMALSVLAPFIKADLTLSDGQLGLLTGLAFSLFYAVCGIPVARWADRGNRRNIIALALATWSVVTALSGMARNFWHLFAARIGIGACESGCFPAGASVICDYVPLQARGGAFAVHTFGSYVGMVAGMIFASWLGENFGWRTAFVVLGIPGVVFAVVVLLTLREPVRGTFDPKASSARLPFRQSMIVLWQCRTYRLLMLSFVLFGFVQYGMNQWWPSFYVRMFGLGLSFVGFHLGVAIAVGSGIGLLLGGLLSNRAARHDLSLPLKIGALAVSITLPIALASIFVPSARTSMLLVCLTTLCWSVSNGPLVANINSVVRPDMRAIASSIAIFAMSAVGFSLGPLCVGLLSDAFAPTFGAQALRYAMIAPVCLIPVMVLTLYTAAKNLPADLAAMRSEPGQR